MQSIELLQALSEKTYQTLEKAKGLRNYDLEILTWKENDTSWNILECLEHLNLYGDFYLPQIESKIKNTKTHPQKEFKSGILGDLFSKSILPNKAGNKMKTSKDKNPLNQSLDKDVIDRFINQQYTLLNLLHQSKDVSLNKINIRTSFSVFINLKLGDTFKFFVNHVVRHLDQIQKIEQMQKK